MKPEQLREFVRLQRSGMDYSALTLLDLLLPIWEAASAMDEARYHIHSDLKHALTALADHDPGEAAG